MRALAYVASATNLHWSHLSDHKEGWGWSVKEDAEKRRGPTDCISGWLDFMMGRLRCRWLWQCRRRAEEARARADKA